MPDRDGYINGVPCWVDTSQPDPDAAVEFYGRLLGWEMQNVLPVDSPGSYFIARVRGGDVAAIAPTAEGAPPNAEWNSYVWVDDADETTAKVRGAGGQVLVGPFDVSGAGRMAVFSDPQGATFRVWQAALHAGATIVNEPGSVVFNVLHTPDVGAARSFYNSVFGWEVLQVGSGLAWRLPGYGDFLERTDPDLRKRMADGGAPELFEDVVAGLNALSGDEQDLAPHWSVTFAVEDADAIAELASALGGRVIVPPLDAPWSRMAVIADPQGARFTASRFAPENRDVEPLSERALAAA